MNMDISSFSVHPLAVTVGLVTPKVLPYQLKKGFSVNLMDPVSLKTSVEGTTVNGSKTFLSQITPIISGAPQGSVLGPLLSLIYIESVTKLHLSHGTKLSLYADDLYKHIYPYDDYTELQRDINLFYNWPSENHLVFNTSKCKQIVISRKRNQYNFRTILLGNEALEIVQRYKYLGVMITSNLSWSEHIHTKCVKAKKLIGLLTLLW